MTVNAAVFTCSICGEGSVNICAYCTKDACSNHRCERCKRCSDCCECEYPLSAEESVPVEAVTEPVPEVAPEATSLEPAAPEPASSVSSVAHFLTPEESSVFAAPKPPAAPRIFGESNVFVEEDESVDENDPPEPLP
jgi:hypothetical protein